MQLKVIFQLKSEIFKVNVRKFKIDLKNLTIVL